MPSCDPVYGLEDATYGRWDSSTKTQSSFGRDGHYSSGGSERQPCFIPGKNKLYPAPVSFDDAGRFDDPEVFDQVPWFDMDDVIDGNSIPHYSHERFITGGIPLREMGTESWSLQ